MISPNLVDPVVDHRMAHAALVVALRSLLARTRFADLGG
jgi:hypothetical protein